MSAEIEATLLQNAKFVHRLAHRWAKDNDAEDLRQDIYLAALQSPPRDEAWPAWLMSTARRLAARSHRSEKRQQKDQLLQVQNDQTVRETADVVLELEAHEQVLSAVTQLPDIYRDPIVLKFYEGLENREIATRLGLSYVNVRARLWRAMATLRAHLDPDHRPLKGVLGAGSGISMAKAATPMVASMGGLILMSTKLIISLGVVIAVTLGVLWWPSAPSRLSIRPMNRTNAAEDGRHEDSHEPLPPALASLDENAVRTVVPVQGQPEEKTEEVVELPALPAPGFVDFRPVDGVTSAPLLGVHAHFVSPDRFGELLGAKRARLTPGTYQLGLLAPGYDPLVIDSVTVRSGEITDLGSIALRPGSGTILGKLLADLPTSTPVDIELHGKLVMKCTECHSIPTLELERFFQESNRDTTEPSACQRNLPTLKIQRLLSGRREFEFNDLAEGNYYLRARVDNSMASDTRSVSLSRGSQQRTSLALDPTTALKFHIPPKDQVSWPTPKHSPSDWIEEPLEEIGEEELTFTFFRDGKLFAACGFSFEGDILTEEVTSIEFEHSASDRLDRPRHRSDRLIPEFPKPTFGPLRPKVTFLEPNTFVVEPLPIAAYRVEIMYLGARAHPLTVDLQYTHEVNVAWP